MGLKKFIKKISDKMAASGNCGIVGTGKNGYLGSVDCGQFGLDFYYDEENPQNCKVDIRCGVVMEVTLNATHDGYGFLLSCYHDKANDAMEAYCGMLWQCSHLLAMDSYFAKRVMQSWQKYFRGLEKQAKIAADEITKEQEEADTALMDEAVRIASMDEYEREQYHTQVAGRLANILDSKNKGGSKGGKGKNKK